MGQPIGSPEAWLISLVLLKSKAVVKVNYPEGV
jgi:hypothetical protein